MATLDRTTFEISRAAEYFQPEELEKQTGQPRNRFAVVVLKELADNALDAAEAKGVAPEIDLVVEVQAAQLRLTVADNGAGLPPETVSRILNFTTRTSDKSAYRSPTRGAQGNALKTVIGIPFAMGSSEPVIIEGRGVRHTLCSRLDPSGEPIISPRPEQCGRQAGTSVSLCLPAEDQQFAPIHWARAFSVFNPHAMIRIRVLGETTYLANCPDGETEDSYHPTVLFPDPKPKGWRKFLPTDLTSAWWYSESDLSKLIGLHNVVAQRGEKALRLREFVRQFRGLSGSAAAKKVCDAVPQETLADFDGDSAAVPRLLCQMQAEAQPPSPGVLGRIGEEHLRARFDEWYGVKRFWYSKAEGLHNGVPFFFEVAVAETKMPGQVFGGVNFSPSFGDPFAQTGLFAGEIKATGIVSFLGNAHVREPWRLACNTAVAVHLVCPCTRPLDRGKSQLEITREMASDIAVALWKAVKELYKEGEQRRKDAGKQRRQQEAFEKQLDRAQRQEQWNLKDAVFQVLSQAMAKASGDGEFPVSARTLFYQVRPLIQPYTEKELEYDYFSQELLTRYRRDVGPLTGLYYDPRGVLYEPHSGDEVPLGTREVEAYQFPAWRYNKILYIEKKGLWPQIQQAKLAERYDMAVMASEGFATEAARILLANADKGQQYRFFVLHDADPSGYEIARTLQEETSRMPGYKVGVTDLGLRFDDAVDLGLQTERFTRRKRLSSRMKLTARERLAFEGRRVYTGGSKDHWDCERVELNAFTAPDFLAYVERRLQEEGATDKVIPPDASLEHRLAEWHVAALSVMAEEAIKTALKSEELKESIVSLLRGRLDTSRIRERIEEDFKRDRSQLWDDVVHALAHRQAAKLRSEIDAAVAEEIKKRLA